MCFVLDNIACIKTDITTAMITLSALQKQCSKIVLIQTV